MLEYPEMMIMVYTIYTIGYTNYHIYIYVYTNKMIMIVK